MRKLTLFLLALLVIPAVYSIGVAPAYKEIFFEPGKELDLSFRILNNEKKDMDVMIYGKGELANNAEIPTSMHLRSDELEKNVDYKVILPLKLTPGLNTLSIFAVESNIDNDNIDVVTTNLGVVYKLKVNVPYPGKYLQGMMFIEGSNPDENILFTLSLNNLGTDKLTDIKGTVVIRDPSGNGVSQIVTSTASLESKEKGKITGIWLPKERGRYIAQAVISYNDEVLLIEKELEIGEAQITVKDLRTVKFKLGDIAKLDILLENNWNEDITNILTKTVIYDESSNIISDFSSSPVDINKESTKEVPSYWETQEVEPGNYVINIMLEYLGKRNEKSYEVSVDEDSFIVLNGATGNVVQSEKEDFNMIPFLSIIAIIAIITLGIKFIPKTIKKKTNRYQIDPKIKEYLKTNLSQGISIKALRQKLLDSGYKEDYVDQAILEAEDETH
ncbi:MAG: hypothetical protein NDI94_03885 [Candidatus Woesearchaeota archaeon]|nr:hypothetical protein [Candidatus Woesearchaeota archaeon]